MPRLPSSRPPAPAGRPGRSSTFEHGAGLRVIQGLARIGWLLRQEHWSAAAPRGLSATQVQLLSLLAARGEGVRAGQLAGELALTPPTVTDSLHALEAKGLIRRSPDPGDRRAQRVNLTPKGRRLAQRELGWPELLTRTVERLQPAEQGALLRALVKMIRLLQLEGRIPVARLCATCQFFRPNVHRDPGRPHHCAYVDAPFGDRGLRLDCPDYRAASPEQQAALWTQFAGAT